MHSMDFYFVEKQAKDSMDFIVLSNMLSIE